MPRLMEIDTPLGTDVLLFHGMHAREELGRVSQFQVDLLSERGDINLDDILGQNVTVKLMKTRDQIRYFNGYVTRFAQAGKRGRYHRYLAVVRPWLWFLSRTADCRIFQNKTVPEILRAVFSDHGTAEFAVELAQTYEPWTYCVQYRETDLNFVSRLMEHEGIYYYFRHTDGHNTMVLVDSSSAHSPCPNAETVPFLAPERLVRPELEHISRWDFGREVQPGAFVHDHYDMERPSLELKTTKSFSRGYSPSDYEIYDYPGCYVKKQEGTRYAEVRLDEYGAQFEAAHATANHRALTVGYLFTLDGFPRTDQNREHLIVSTDYDLEYSAYEGLPKSSGGGVRCSLTAMSSGQQYRPKRSTPKPFVQGPQTAVVVGPAGDEIHTDKFGRVKVQFHWDRYGTRDENSSCWVRVSHPWAGKGWGSVATPRIGQEVIVDFLEGDPDQPIITGRVYNAECQPPFGFPAGAVLSGIKSSTHKGSGYNELSMDDTAGKEKITIHAQYDMNTTVEHDQTNTVNNDSTETIKNNATITITDGTYSHDVKTGTATYHVQSALTEKYDATQETTVKDALTITSTAGAISITSNTQHIELKAATYIQLECGASKIKMDSGGNISVTGVVVGITGKASVTTKGGMVHSEADAQHQTKGAIVLSEGTATNTIKGGMVMLN